MAKTALNTIKNWFVNGSKPPQEHFWNWLDSFWHKDESIPQNSIEGLANTLSQKADVAQLLAKANIDASNVSGENRAIWRQVLGISDLQIEGPFNNTAEALTAVPVARRKIGKTVVVLIPGNESQIGVAQEYWWRFGTADEDLVVKNVGDGSGGGASFPATGNDGDVLEKDSAVADGVKWVEKNTTSAVNNFLHYWNSATKKWISSGLKFVAGAINQLEFTGRIKADAIILPNNTNPAVANRLRSDGYHVYYENDLAVSKRLAYAQANVFVYTPTGNFALSTVKTAMESAGYVFDDSTISVVLGTNNFICSIDIGASNNRKTIYIDREGSGSLSFTSTRTLNSGGDAITILNGNEGSIARIKFGTSQDILTVRNL